MRILITSIILFLIPTLVMAKNKNYCAEYGLGWHFYCEESNPREQNPKLPSKNTKDYSAQIKQMREELDNRKAKAILYPTEENVADYMKYQQKVLNQAGVFADQWRRVIWQNPGLDYTLKRPTSKIGKEAWIDERNKEVKTAIQNINERYGIFFLFRSDCPYCHKYSPVLLSFRDKYKVTIIPVSMDGGVLPGWGNILFNKGNIERMGIQAKAVPATILFDKKNKDVIPIGFGVLSHSQLEERIYATTKLEVGDDF